LVARQTSEDVSLTPSIDRATRTRYSRRVAARNSTTSSRGSIPFDEIGSGDCWHVGLPRRRIHSQSFSLSQRFNPTRTLWSYFVPHPSIGFWSSESSPLNQQLHLSMPDTLMPLSTRSANSRETRSFTGAPAFHYDLRQSKESSLAPTSHALP
jgi:hypothetical protein